VKEVEEWMIAPAVCHRSAFASALILVDLVYWPASPSDYVGQIDSAILRFAAFVQLTEHWTPKTSRLLTECEIAWRSPFASFVFDTEDIYVNIL
jgi:hypothetical protein